MVLVNGKVQTKFNFILFKGDKVVENEDHHGWDYKGGYGEEKLHVKVVEIHIHSSDKESRTDKVGKHTEDEDLEDVFFVPLAALGDFQSSHSNEKHNAVKYKVTGQNYQPYGWEK